MTKSRSMIIKTKFTIRKEMFTGYSALDGVKTKSFCLKVINLTVILYDKYGPVITLSSNKNNFFFLFFFCSHCTKKFYDVIWVYIKS